MISRRLEEKISEKIRLPRPTLDLCLNFQEFFDLIANFFQHSSVKYAAKAVDAKSLAKIEKFISTGP